MLLSIAAIGTALDPIFTLSPALAERAGHASSSAGLIVAAWGSGAVGAILLGRRAIRAMSEHGLGWIGLLVLFVGLAGLGLGSTSFPAMIAAAIVAGVGYITATMAFTTTIQASVPEALRGRIMAMWTLAFLGPRALAAVVDGWLGDHIGAAPTTVAFGTVALAGAILLRRVQPGIGEPVPPPA
jgi:MFS family permease